MSAKKKEAFSSWTKIINQLHLAENQQALDELMREWIKPHHQKTLAFINAHAMNLAYESTAFANDLTQADYLLRDGSGMAILLKWLHVSPGLNLNGTDLIPRIVTHAQAKTIALIGTQSPYLEQAKQVLQTGACKDKSIYTLDGFQDAQAYIAFCQQFQPEIIVLGMGMPKQEHIAQLLKNALSHGCLIICGGAIIDFWGGKVSRAPMLIRRLNVEWIYRLLLEPKRLFKRYVVGNPVFLFRSKLYVKQRIN